MSKKFLLLVTSLIAIPTIALAGIYDSTGLLPKDQTIDDNYYMASDNPTILGNVNGDLMVAGGNVTISGEVKKDLTVAGGNVVINGNVGDDIRVFAGNVTLNGTVGGEVILAAGDVQIGPKTQITKDLTVAAGTVKLDPAAKVTGKTIIHQDESENKPQPAPTSNFLTASYWLGELFWVLALITFAVIWYAICPISLKALVKHSSDKTQVWKNLGLGFALLIGLPFAVIFALVIPIGFWLSLVLISVYFLLIFVSVAYSGMWFGNLVQMIVSKDSYKEFKLIWGIGGIAVLHLLTLLPFVGWAISLVFFLMSMGGLVTFAWKQSHSVQA